MLPDHWILATEKAVPERSSSQCNSPRFETQEDEDIDPDAALSESESKLRRDLDEGKIHEPKRAFEINTGSCIIHRKSSIDSDNSELFYDPVDELVCNHLDGVIQKDKEQRKLSKRSDSKRSKRSSALEASLSEDK